MSSVFISFCFIKTLSGTKRSINGTALYRALSNTQDEFREFIFKVYIESEESLIQEFEKETIVLMVAICNGCKNSKTCQYPSILTEIPSEIISVPMTHRRYLSPVHMKCSLGRTPDTNNYTNYRYLQGSINITHNYQSLEIYSGTIDAYLNIHEPPRWFHESLIPACEWLRGNNHIIKKYHSNINITPPRPESPTPIPLPLARQSIDYHQAPSDFQCSFLSNETPYPPDLVVSNNSFPQEIHNEDTHHTRLIAGLIANRDEENLPILFNNPDLEALMFPDLFSKDSYGKYIKLRMLCPDPRFRLHWYWPHWSYLNLEKRRNFQNQYHLLSTRKVNCEHHPTVTDLIIKSSYDNRNIIDKSKTTTIPSYLRTATPYFKKKQQQVNTMIHSYRLPQIFYTMTIAKDKWPHLHQILHADHKIKLTDHVPKVFLNPYLKQHIVQAIHYNTFIDYVTSTGFAKYITKYITKLESSELFDIDEQDEYRKHIIARRLGTMELMDELPYWDDAIDKYFDRPDHENFITITYPDYFRNYTIGLRRPGQRSKLFHAQDRKGRIIIQRKSPILLRFTNYNIQNGEPFFFQHLIMKIHARSEQDLLDGNTTYRDRFQALFPIRYNQAINSIHK
ncbi:4740_t:CDS:2, partial [Acaulospora morrowiae]